MEERKKYRISYFRDPQHDLISVDHVSDDLLEKLPSHYIYSTRCVNLETGEVVEKSYILLDSVKKFRKKETVVNFGDTIDIGLDDY